MKRLLIIFCAANSGFLMAGDYKRTVHKVHGTLRIRINTQKSVITRQKNDSTKKWKHAFLKKDTYRLQRLEQNNHPINTSLERQNALLSILARKANYKDRKELFETGLRNGLYTVDAAVGASKAMRRHAENLAHLVTQARMKTSQKIYYH